MAAAVVGGIPAAAAADFHDYTLGDFYSLAKVEESVVHDSSEAVVRFPTASGFFVDPDGLILTNHHVYESFGDSGRVWRRWVGDGSEQALEVELVTRDREHDVALYRVTDPAKAGPFPFLELRDTPVHHGEAVFVLGHPRGKPLRASFGTILADELTIGGRPSIEYSAQTWWGSSGSPVIDEQGRAVAIHWGWDSKGVSNGRLTGVPAVKITDLPGFTALGRADAPPTLRPSECDAHGWALRSNMVREAARQNDSGKWLDQVEVRALHPTPGCADQLDSVTYTLHPTFADPVETLDGDAALTLYTWGSFDATVKVRLDDGGSVTFVDRVSWK
ncbi:protease, Do family protein [Plesiocystis pacifica SIR-1]|uniref:Serine protease n=1 Tax=Plesiocystis pacifica SIR-1 TaxID=391625 RepID=A6G2X2_9BACT|nr:trypsin-like peptidase domain-containing protein [Plesiocystis pacifica]EDM79822.1 protease, Do family protein [Plesiocystis pacifica SIR-1]